MLSFNRRFRSAITEHLPVKFSALFFAVVMWVIVRSEEPSEAWIDELRRPEEDRVDEVEGRLYGLRAQVGHRFWDQSHRLGRVRGSPK